MQNIVKWRWVILGGWLLAATLLTIFQPDVNAILHDRGQDPLTSESPSKVAGEILTKMSGQVGTSNIIVFHNEDSLTETDMSQIQQAVENIREHQSKLGINEMIDPFAIPDAKDSLISEDNTTLMVSFTLDKQDREVNEIKSELEEELKGVDTDYYLSGEDFIQNDYLEASTSGVEKSALLTVGFILIVLIIMFRSIVIPFISLLTVGITYLVSMGIAAQIIDKLNFPVTSVTQMLLVLILFGIGTDYNILLFHRFKEELSNGATINQSIFTTYKTAGKTIFYSTLTVFIAFAALSFSNFGIYKSANVVAIGAIILILQIFTLTPFFMKTIGGKLFWPSKHNTGHKESKFWTKLTSVSVKYPVITTILIIIIMIPILFFSKQTLSFDQLGELGDDYPSTKGFSIVAEHFSRGQALPTNVVIESDKAMDNNEALIVIDQITEDLKDLDGVKQVASVTQPQSQQITDFYIDNQTALITEGIDASKEGVEQILGGLTEMESKLEQPDFSEAKQLVTGTGEIQSGYQQLTNAVGQLGSGYSQSAEGANGLTSGINDIRTGLIGIATNTKNIAEGLSELQVQYTSLSQGYLGLEQQQLPTIQTGMVNLNGLITQLGESHIELKEDETYLALKKQGSELQSGISQFSGGIQGMNQNFDSLNTAFNNTNMGLDQINEAQAVIISGLQELEAGAEQLTSGLQNGAAGSDEITANMRKLNNALSEVKNGQQQLNDGLSQFSTGLGALKDGLNRSGNGLQDISDGLGKTSDFLGQFKSAKTFFIPREALESADFSQVLDSFMSEDRKIIKFIVILSDDPYSMDAMETIENINKVLENGLQGTLLEDATYGAAGPSSTTYDTNKVQLESFTGTAIIVIIGVFLVLLFVIRSFLPAVYIIISLIAAYFVAMAATNLVTYQILGADGVSSFVPFFSFIIIVAVGVDYSIFFMMRYKEYNDIDPAKALVESSKHIGGVIISAMIILGGTFATLIPSGLVLLIELAVAVITGLIVLCFILLPMLVPALIVLPSVVKKKQTSN
ncbi:MMPL family transporter [Bacillus sp. DJP31]|uniref:MMPL family transporter n=1 Tax=Bacillus sp. DJP31 TaxID=3409789 RepID=UPI003BB53B2D